MSERLLELVERLLRGNWICVSDGRSAQALAEACADAEVAVAYRLGRSGHFFKLV